MIWSLTVGDWRITKPSSAALLASVWGLSAEEDDVFVIANDDEVAEPLVWISSGVALEATTCGICWGSGLLWSANFLATYRRKPPSY